MASPAVAIPQLNGALSHGGDSPVSINSATKRKRDASDDSEAAAAATATATASAPTAATTAATNGSDANKPAVNGLHAVQPQKTLIRDFYDVLQSLDSESHAILRRPLPDGFSDSEPQAKRSKSEDTTKPTTIDDKMRLNVYEVVDDLVADVMKAVKALISDLEMPTAAEEGDHQQIKNEAIARATKFKNRTLELFRRELAYPLVARPLPAKAEARNGNPTPVDNGGGGGIVLTTYGMAPTMKPVFTSLQSATTANGAVRELSISDLPSGISISRVGQGPVTSTDKNTRSLTLGELFPSPRNLPPLQPPKAIKNTTKSNVLTFYHPELTERSKYRSGSFFSMNLSTGNWLDYSNATPTTHGKTKQRERAQSLAGVKPSSTELEMSEMEALFRGAFSSFAPCKDDAGAVIPSSQVSHIWWQRIGRRNFDKLADVEFAEDEGGERAQPSGSAPEMDIDESLIQDAIENWDDAMIDPSLDEALGKKSEEEKTIDDILEEVSDLIETLASHQRNRNLTLPTSQDRYSTDPVNGDMLRHGSLSHQPNEDEMATYQALKAHLSLIINTLPPYAVARLNSDKLEELNVSLKIEVRTDEYKGVMEEDEPARLARQAHQQQQHQQQQQAQQAQQSANQQRAQHRSSSVSSAASFAPHHQYGSPFQQPNRPMSVQQPPYPHTPVRPQGPAGGMYPQRAPSTVPIPQPHPSQARPPPPQQYRPPNYGGYAPQLAKSQTPYGHSSMQYASSPGQPRIAQPMPAYPGMSPAGAGTPNHRYAPSYAGYQPMHPQHAPSPAHAPPPPHAAQPQHMPPQPPYMQYTNGSQMPRTMSPQVPPVHGYSPSPTPPQQHQHMPRPPYGTPGSGVPPNAAQHIHYAGTPGGAPAGLPQGMTPQGTPQGIPPQGAVPPPGGPQQGAPAAGGSVGGVGSVVPNTGGLSFRTHLNEGQLRQVVEQANARVRAQQTASGHMGKVAMQGEVGAGLAGIGLGAGNGNGSGNGNGNGNATDMHKMAVQHKIAQQQQQQPQQQPQQQQQLAGGASPSTQLPIPAAATITAGPSPVNGAMVPPPSVSPASVPGSSVSPAPGGMGFKPPA